MHSKYFVIPLLGLSLAACSQNTSKLANSTGGSSATGGSGGSSAGGSSAGGGGAGGSGGAAGSGGTSGDAGAPTPGAPLPFTPQGCNYQVHAPSSTTAAVGSDKVGASPTPIHVHVSWAGPTDSTFAVNWKTGVDTLLSDIVYGTDKAAVTSADGAGTGVTMRLGYTIEYGGAPLFPSQETRVHETHVCGLQPGTTYYYKVGGPGHWSSVYDVATGPTVGSTKPFRFVVTGDSRNDPTIWAQTQQMVQQQAPDFQLFSGDAVDLGPNQSEWDALFEATTGTFKTEDYLATCPLMPVNGNHDNLAVNYIAEFALPQVVSPGESAQGEEWYSFDYGNAHFVMLNDTAPTSALQAQATWMKQDLGAIDHSKIQWIFAVHHQPTYSSSQHGSNMTLRNLWGPIFDQYKVDIVFNGHDHDYERSKPMRGGQVASGSGANGAPVNQNGTVYVVAAGAGAPLYASGTSSFTQISESTRNYVVIDISGKKLTYTAYRLDGSTLDTFTIQK